MEKSKLELSLSELEEALLYRKKSGSGTVADAAVSKCFEVSLEYAWKELKRRIEAEGLEAFSPKECIKVAANLGLIDNPEKWIDFINIRNLSVHDYIGLNDSDYYNSITEFFAGAKELILALRKK